MGSVLNACFAGMPLAYINYTVGSCVRIIFDENEIFDPRREYGALDLIFESDNWNARIKQFEFSSRSDPRKVIEFLNGGQIRKVKIKALAILSDGRLRIDLSDGFLECKPDNRNDDEPVAWYLKINNSLDLYCGNDGSITM